MLKILIADDDAGDRRQIRRALKQAGVQCDCTEAPSIKKAIEACDQLAYDCAIVDYRLPGEDGLAGIADLHEKRPHMAIIMSTGQGSVSIATEAMKLGALDYIPKCEITAESLKRITMCAIETANLHRKIAQQRELLEQFACLLVHDIKAPIRAILSFAGSIEKDIEGENPARAIEDCRRVVKAAQRLDKLIETLHQYTKAGEQVEFGPVEMQQVMNDTLSNLEQLIQQRGARVTHGEMPAVVGNAPQLVQLLQNLISNAIKYCEADIPSIHVTASGQEESGWLVSVSDNGIGIPEEHYQRVFDSFRRLHGVGKYDGIGLGLATCKRIVDRHGGRIWCESKQGQGTTFFFTLPGAPCPCAMDLHETETPNCCATSPRDNEP